MEARKGNKVYQVDEQSAKAYQAHGYDIYDGGKLVQHAAGKTVPIAEHEKVKAELEEAKKPRRTAKEAEKDSE